MDLSVNFNGRFTISGSSRDVRKALKMINSANAKIGLATIHFDQPVNPRRYRKSGSQAEHMRYTTLRTVITGEKDVAEFRRMNDPFEQHKKTFQAEGAQSAKPGVLENWGKYLREKINTAPCMKAKEVIAAIKEGLFDTVIGAFKAQKK